MGLFFKRRSTSYGDREVAAALERAFESDPPATQSGVTQMVANAMDAMPERWQLDPSLRMAVTRAVSSPACSASAAKEQAKRVARELGGDSNGGPNWWVFVGTAALLVIVLAFAVSTATAADAQPKEVANSQLKTLSGTLITAFTTLLGAVVGMITGEAVSKAESA